ncbi:MAG: hypothetical protein IJ058_03450 [Lachnospiraceae bacterium]|nr:hypothetical protein [Lachnospiraceae bacterium]
METVEISDSNLDNFLQILGEDLTDDLKRIYYRGIGVTDNDGNAIGALVCELVNSDSDDDKSSRIGFLKSGSKEIFDALHGYYQNNTVAEEEISDSCFELTDAAETKALSGVGFSCEKKESETVVITLGELADSKLAKVKKTPSHIGSIESLSILQYRDTVKQILFMGHNGVMEDIAYLPMNWFDGRVSSCVISGDLVTGLFLIRRTPSGVLIPALYSAFGLDSKKNLLYMLEYSLQKALQEYPSDTRVMIMRKNAYIRALTDKLIPGQQGIEVFCGTRKE